MRRAIAVMVLALTVAAATPGMADAGLGPTPTPTPAYELNPPAIAAVQLDHVRWSDTSRGEDGYRLRMTIGTTTRVFTLPADTTRFDFPEDFRPGCGSPHGPQATITIVAFRGDEESEPAVGSSPGVLCPPFTVRLTLIVERPDGLPPGTVVRVRTERGVCVEVPLTDEELAAVAGGGTVEVMVHLPPQSPEAPACTADDETFLIDLAFPDGSSLSGGPSGTRGDAVGSVLRLEMRVVRGVPQPGPVLPNAGAGRGASQAPVHLLALAGALALLAGVALRPRGGKAGR